MYNTKRLVGAAAKPLLHKVEGVLEVLSELLADGAPEVVGVVALAYGGRDPVVGGLMCQVENSAKRWAAGPQVS